MMSLSEDQLNILKMLEAQTISAEEAATLLQSNAATESVGRDVNEAAARWLRVRITDIDSGQARVNINVPIGLLDISLRMGARLVPGMSEADYAQLIGQLQKSQPGITFEFFDDADAEKIELSVE